MTAEQIAHRLGKARREGLNWRCICPLHGGHSLSLRDGHRGQLLVKCWAGCEPSDIFAELRRLHLFDRAGGASPLPGDPGDPDEREDRERRQAIARRLWREARDPRQGGPMAAYLTARGIITPPVPNVLRYAPFLWRRDGPAGPAMVARVDSCDGELIGIHRTWIERGPDGIWRRRDRASLGPIAGGAVRLKSAGETLLVAEGVETTLSGMQATDLPGWAALSTGGLMALILPRIVRHVVIVADHDRSGAGERAARTAAQRWRGEARRVSIYMSPRVGEDAADLILAAAAKERHAA
jgi:putative DNA primase/helicase